MNVSPGLLDHTPPFREYVGRRFGKRPDVFWDVIPIENRPINYLEIGVFHGNNFFHVAKSFASHPNSRLYGIDPWMDYEGYNEYKGQNESNYNVFKNNLNNSGLSNKCTIYRDLSQNVVSKFQDSFFDLIFIDGSHETEYVYNDSKNYFQKLKVGGYLVFDDYDWEGVKKGVDMFLSETPSCVVLKSKHYQLFCKKD